MTVAREALTAREAHHKNIVVAERLGIIPDEIAASHRVALGRWVGVSPGVFRGS